MNNSTTKRYEITDKKPVGKWPDVQEWEWIPHERQPMTLISAVLENRDTFQKINNDFWLNHVEPFFLKNGKKKLSFGRKTTSNEDGSTTVAINKTSGYWDGIVEKTPSYDIALGQVIKLSDCYTSPYIEYQNEIYSISENYFSENKIKGDFTMDTINNALLMFISSDVKNASKYLKILSLKNDIFSFPAKRLYFNQGFAGDLVWNYEYEGFEEIKSGIPKDYANIYKAYGFNPESLYGHDSFNFYNMANRLVHYGDLNEDVINIIASEFKIKSATKEIFSDGFMEFVAKEKSKILNIKLPNKIQNKMDLSIWKSVASKNKITNESFEKLIQPFGWNKSSHPYFFEAMNHLLNKDEKLGSRKYFKSFINYNSSENLLSEISGTLNPFWFKHYFKELSNLYEYNSYINQKDKNLESYTMMLPFAFMKYLKLSYSSYLIDESAVSEDDKLNFENALSFFKNYLRHNKNTCSFTVNDLINQNDKELVALLEENKNKVGNLKAS